MGKVKTEKRTVADCREVEERSVEADCKVGSKGEETVPSDTSWKPRSAVLILLSILRMRSRKHVFCQGLDGGVQVHVRLRRKRGRTWKESASKEAQQSHEMENGEGKGKLKTGRASSTCDGHRRSARLNGTQPSCERLRSETENCDINL